MNIFRAIVSRSRIRWVTVLSVSALLLACDGSGGPNPATDDPVTAGDDEAEARYREKVKRRVSSSVVSSFSREWNVSESNVECVLADLDVTQLDDAASDAAVAAVFKTCGVDPAVAE